MKNFIQGDVSFHEIKSLPKGLKPCKDNILALGEVTGHAHRLKSGQICVFEDDKGNKYAKLKQETELIHDHSEQEGVIDKQQAQQQNKHVKQTIPAGTYAIMIEQQYNPFTEELTKVMD